MTVKLFIGGRRVDALDAGDRGLAYGDGLFETLRLHQGRPVWWDAHLDRLAMGAARLGIDPPERRWLRAQADPMMAGDGVLKLILTRGSGGRGYAVPEPAQPTLLLARHPLPPPCPPGGLMLRWCRLQLAAQPLLAGLKHLNRLEQVLARAEWRDPAIDEGLLCDADGNLVSAVSGNVFLRFAGRWLTPRLDACGIAGICRAWLIDAIDAHVVDIARADVERADALFVCNSVRGILPVAGLDGRYWPPDAETRRVRGRLADVQPAFGQAMESM